MTQAQLTTDANQQVQGNCQTDVHTDTHQLAAHEAREHTGLQLDIHNGKCHNDHQEDHVVKPVNMNVCAGFGNVRFAADGDILAVGPHIHKIECDQQDRHIQRHDGEEAQTPEKGNAPGEAHEQRRIADGGEAAANVRDEARKVELVKGHNIESLPEFDDLPDELEVPVLLKVGDNVSTDEIMPAGSRVLPYRSNIPKMAEFVYIQVDDTYSKRAADNSGEHAIVGGDNYGQGSSREHAVIAPRYLGLRVVVAKSFARIHWQNLANFGVLALEFENPEDYERLNQDDVLRFTGLHEALQQGSTITADLNGEELTLRHRLSERQVDMVLAGGRIPHRAATKASSKETPEEEIRPIQPEG